MTELQDVLAPGGGLRAAYQPIVELASGAVVGYEALARGPVGTDLERPDLLFAAATAAGRLTDLDWACRTVALTGAHEAGLAGPLALFVNVEPAALGTDAPEAFAEVAARIGDRLPIVVEFTERALAADPARLLAAADQVRAQGWGVAVDDIGAERASLALMPFLAPDVLKLDLRLVQKRTTVEIAEVVTAVNAQAERTGALVLAEGIETPEHEQLARAMGARLAQGWLYGRPGPLPAGPPAAGPQVVTLDASARWRRTETPFELVARSRAVQRSTKPLLVAMSKHLERQALALGGPAVVATSFQHARHFTAATSRRYAALGASAELVVALGEQMPAHPVPDVPGLIGVTLDSGDPVNDEWSIAVVGPHFAGALLARDLGDAGPESERRFDYVVTYDRELVLTAAGELLRRAAVPQT